MGDPEHFPHFDRILERIQAMPADMRNDAMLHFVNSMLNELNMDQIGSVLSDAKIMAKTLSGGDNEALESILTLVEGHVEMRRLRGH